MQPLVYLLVSGTVTAHRAGEIVAGLRQHFARVLTLPTPNAARVISPHDLRRIPENHVVESYFDERILPRPTPAPVLFAPCSFNSLNKLAHGIADNLALAVAAEMIGFGQRVVVALSVNEPLFAHPAVRQSLDTLRRWGVRVVLPKNNGNGLTMAPTDEILHALNEDALL